MIEIERKYTAPNDIADRLLSAGAQQTGGRSLRDIYYDTADLKLARSDQWLRLRNDRWELKRPPSGSRNRSTTAKIYEEIEGSEDVVVALTGAADASHAPKGKSLLAFLEREAGLPLVVLLGLETDRCHYDLDGLGIDVDKIVCHQSRSCVGDHLAHSAYHIVEVEAMVADSTEIQAAENRVDSLAQKLGLGGEVMGKVDYFLSKLEPEVFDTLCSMGILDRARESP